jgi:hypothetical protein
MRDTSSTPQMVMPVILVEAIQMLQPSQHHLLARLLNLASQEDFVENGIDLLASVFVCSWIMKVSPCKS